MEGSQDWIRQELTSFIFEHGVDRSHDGSKQELAVELLAAESFLKKAWQQQVFWPTGQLPFKHLIDWLTLNGGFSTTDDLIFLILDVDPHDNNGYVAPDNTPTAGDPSGPSATSTASPAPADVAAGGAAAAAASSDGGAGADATSSAGQQPGGDGSDEAALPVAASGSAQVGSREASDSGVDRDDGADPWVSGGYGSDAATATSTNGAAAAAAAVAVATGERWADCANDGGWTWSTPSPGKAWGTDDEAAGSADAASVPNPLKVIDQPPAPHAGTSAAAPATYAPKPRAIAGGGSVAGPLPAEGLSALVLVVFPGSDVVARLRRCLVAILREKPQLLVTFAEVGIRLSQHPEMGPVWKDPANHLPKLKEFVEAAAAVVPDALKVERNDSWNQFVVMLDLAALRKAALRRAAAAAYPADDDVSLIRRAAAAALIEAEPAGSGVRHSLNMPALGQAVIQAASEPRQRLAKSRGVSFSLAAVLTERAGQPGGQQAPEPTPGHQHPHNQPHQQANGGHANHRHGGEGGGYGGGYIVISAIGGAPGPKAARLDAERLIADAAAGRLGDLASVQPVPLRAAITGTAVVADSAASSSSTQLPSSISPRVRDVLRAAVPEGRPDMHAKRALALLAAASLGASTAAVPVCDPPFTVRSSPCGILLQELGLKPPKGQMRALFDDEPHIFKAAKPSPNYLIELVHEPLLELAAQHPEELAASVAVLLRGKSYVGLRFRTPSSGVANGVESAATATAAPAGGGYRFSAAAAAPLAAATSAPAGPVGAAVAAASRAISGGPPAAVSRPWDTSAAPPADQPADYYVRLERALQERLDGNSATEFVNRARRAVAHTLLRRTWRTRGPTGQPPHSMSVKDVAALLKRELPEAYQERRPPGVFPINAVVLAQQMQQLFIVDKSSPNPRDWAMRLNINSLELAAGLTPTNPTGREAEWGPSESEDIHADYYAEEDVGDEDDEVATHAGTLPTATAASVSTAGGFGAAGAGGAAAPAAATMSATSLADLLATQPARALAAALAPTIPPDLLPEPETHFITLPYSSSHVTALAHCLSCPQIGLSAKCVAGMPALVMLYAPAVDSLKPAAAVAASAGAPLPPPASVLPATVYVLDAAAAGPTDGVALLASLRTLLEEPGVAKVVHGCEQLVPGLEHAVGCCISPLLDTRLVSEMLKPLDLNPPPQPSSEEVVRKDDGSGPELWPLPSNWQAALTAKYWDYHVAARQHASGTDSSWLSRPLNSGQMGMVVRSVQHLPELWSALTWLLPRLAQFCSVARAQQCRAMLAPAAAW